MSEILRGARNIAGITKRASWDIAPSRKRRIRRDRDYSTDTIYKLMQPLWKAEEKFPEDVVRPGVYRARLQLFLMQRAILRSQHGGTETGERWMENAIKALTEEQHS